MVGEFQKISQRIDQIYAVIGEDIQNFKIKDPQDIDYSYHYCDLKEIFQYILKNNRWVIRSNKKIRLLFFAFAIEIFNCENFQSGFWNTLFSETSTDNSIRSICFNSLIDTCEEFGIKTKRIGSDKRFFVYSIKGKAIRDRTIWKYLGAFFVDYFRSHRNEKVEVFFRKFVKNIDYLPFINEKEHIIQYTEHATDLFSQLLEGDYDAFDEDAIRKFLNDEGLSLGPFRDKRISSILQLLSNRKTPLEFRKILKTYIDDNIRSPENNLIPARKLLNSNLDFGIYSFGSNNYQLTPNHQIGLNQMRLWQMDTFGIFNKISYFKKSVPFEVQKKEVHRVIYRGDLFFVWCGYASLENGIMIDGSRYRWEGFEWNPELKMTYGDEKYPPEIIIDTGNVTFFNRTAIGKSIKIFIDSMVIGKDITNLEGYSSRRYISVIPQSKNEIKIRAVLEGREIKNKRMVLLDHILFSNSTREQIRDQKEDTHAINRRYGESKYTLFSKYSPQILDSHLQLMNADYSPLNQQFQNYHIYEILWSDDGEFNLKIDTFSWTFQIKKELRLFFAKQENSFSDFKLFDLVIDITNPTRGENPTYQMLDGDYQWVSDRVELDQSSFVNGIYRLKGENILNDSLESNPSSGEYFLEVVYGDLIRRIQFFIIPEINYHWPEILPENQIIPLTFTSPEPCFLDIKTNNSSNTSSQQISGEISEINFGKRITITTHTKELSIPLANPRIVYKKEIPQIPIFGFRLFEIRYNSEKKRTEYFPIQELNFYDLRPSALLIFSKPGDSISLNRGGAEKIQTFNLSANGNTLYSDLSTLSPFCENYQTEFMISTPQGYQKGFKIFWNPRVSDIHSKLGWNDGLKLDVKISLNGPRNSKIKIIVSSEFQDIFSIDIWCNGQNSMYEKTIDLSKFAFSPSFSIRTYCYTFNSEWIPSKILTIPNRYSYRVLIQSGNHFERKEELPYQLFLDKMKNLSEKENDQKSSKSIRIKISTNANTLDILKNLLDLYLNKSNSVHFVVPDRADESILKYISSVRENQKQQIHVFSCNPPDVFEQVNKIIHPYSKKELIKMGLGVSVPQFYENLETFLPFIDKIFLFESHTIPADILLHILSVDKRINWVLVEKTEFSLNN